VKNSLGRITESPYLPPAVIGYLVGAAVTNLSHGDWIWASLFLVFAVLNLWLFAKNLRLQALISDSQATRERVVLFGGHRWDSEDHITSHFVRCSYCGETFRKWRTGSDTRCSKALFPRDLHKAGIN
jgi:hypothetical protein